MPGNITGFCRQASRAQSCFVRKIKWEGAQGSIEARFCALLNSQPEEHSGISAIDERKMRGLVDFVMSIYGDVMCGPRSLFQRSAGIIPNLTCATRAKHSNGVRTKRLCAAGILRLRTPATNDSNGGRVSLFAQTYCEGFSQGEYRALLRMEARLTQTGSAWVPRLTHLQTSTKRYQRLPRSPRSPRSPPRPPP